MTDHRTSGRYWFRTSDLCRVSIVRRRAHGDHPVPAMLFCCQKRNVSVGCVPRDAPGKRAQSEIVVESPSSTLKERSERRTRARLVETRRVPTPAALFEVELWGEAHLASFGLAQ